MPAPPKILDLIERFDRNLDTNNYTKHVSQIEATDRQIDKLVYDLYGLTDEEFKVVEGE